MLPKTQKRNFGICVPIMKFRYISFQTKESLGRAMGKEFRASLARAGRKFCKGDHEGAGKRIRQITCMIQASVRRFDDRNDKR